MRVFVLSGLLVLSLLQVGGIEIRLSSPSTAIASAKSDKKPPVDFERQLKPIFQSRCSPCHFSGGKMYQQLPFDKPETIRKLGTRLFTRIKGEDERRLIDEFIHQGL